MAETNPNDTGPQLTEDQINDAMTASLNGEPEASAEDQVDAPETEQAPDAEDRGVKFDPEKFQQTNRELGNARREITKLTDMVSELREQITALSRKPTERQEAKVEDLRDELEDRIDRMTREGEWTPEQAALIRELRKSSGGSERTLKKLQEKLEQQDEQIRQQADELQASKWERAFNTQFPGLPAGSYQRLSKRAFDQAVEDLGEDADPNQLQGAANGYLIRMARTLSKNGTKVKAAKPEEEVVDKTARNKPAGSTKGADIARKGAAPPRDVSQLSTEELMELEAERLNEEGSLSPG